jgi:glycosyltransferase involved in cell wall biosynthesis
MDGVKRVATVVGNELAKTNKVAYFTLATTPAFFELNAPLITTVNPVNTGKSFRGSKPLTKYSSQINDLIQVLIKGDYDVVILTAGLLTSFSSRIKARVPQVRIIAWLHNNYETYMDNYYRNMQSEFIAGLRSADRVVVLTSHDVIRFSKIQPRSIKIYNPLTIKRGIISSLTNHVISMVSRIDIQQKGLDLLVKIAANIPDDWEIRLAGSGPDENKLRNLISQMNVNNKLRDELLVKEQQSDGTYKTISEDSSELNYPMFPTQMINSNYPLNIQQLPKNLVHLFEHAHLSY